MDNCCISKKLLYYRSHGNRVVSHPEKRWSDKLNTAWDWYSIRFNTCTWYDEILRECAELDNFCKTLVYNLCFTLFKEHLHCTEKNYQNYSSPYKWLTWTRTTLMSDSTVHVTTKGEGTAGINSEFLFYVLTYISMFFMSLLFSTWLNQKSKNYLLVPQLNVFQHVWPMNMYLTESRNLHSYTIYVSFKQATFYTMKILNIVSFDLAEVILIAVSYF